MVERARIDVAPARLVPLGHGGADTIVLVGDGRVAAFGARDLSPRWSASLPPDGAAARFAGRVVHASPDSPTTLLLRDVATGELLGSADLPRRAATPEEATDSAPAMHAAAAAHRLLGRRPLPWRGADLCAADGDRVVVACAPLGRAAEGLASLVTLAASARGLGPVIAEREKPIGVSLVRVWGGRAGCSSRTGSTRP